MASVVRFHLGNCVGRDVDDENVGSVICSFQGRGKPLLMPSSIRIVVVLRINNPGWTKE